MLRRDCLEPTQDQARRDAARSSTRKRAEIVLGPVALLAQNLGLNVEQPESVNDPSYITRLRDLNSDLLVVADFGQILSPSTLASTRLGGITFHASLLPKYRGAAPVAWAIYHGERETGISIIGMTPRINGGGVLLRSRSPLIPTKRLPRSKLDLPRWERRWPWRRSTSSPKVRSISFPKIAPSSPKHSSPEGGWMD